MVTVRRSAMGESADGPSMRLTPYVHAIARGVIDPTAFLPAPPRPPTTSPTVGLVGFYGWGNYGDELFLEAFREHLGEPIRLRTVLDPGEHVWRVQRIGGAVRAADSIVVGGGDIVIPWSTPGSLGSRYWERAYLRRPVFIAGVGVPTWSKPERQAVDRLRAFFRHPSVRYVGTRDAASSAWIVENLGPSAPVVTSPDLVCALTLPPVTRQADPPVFGVSVRSRGSPDDLSHVRRLCERAVELGYRVRRIVLATGRTRERDLEATDGLGLPDTELVASDDLDDISRAIGECTVLASMKFHGVVVASMYGVPAFVLMPTAKNRYFMGDIGRPELVTAYSDPDLADRLERSIAPIAVDVRERLRSGAIAAMTDLRSRLLATAAAR
jgi:polysaccharide pyruvyl transferase WcaK-like protein